MISAVSMWRAANLAANTILFTRTVAPPLPQIGVYGYNKENSGLLDAPYQLAYHLQLCIVILPDRESQVQSC